MQRRTKTSSISETPSHISAALSRAEAAAEAAEDYKSRKRSSSDARLDKSEEHIWQPLGVGLIAEAKIQASIQQGQLNKLKGAGKPFKLEDHGAQFFRVDPGFQAMMRTLGAQNLEEKLSEYNAALLKDKETFPGWPLLPYPTRISLESEMASLRQRHSSDRACGA